MLSLPILKIDSYSSIVIIISLRQIHLLHSLFFLQHVFMVVMQQLEYPVFYNMDTPIKLSLS